MSNNRTHMKVTAGSTYPQVYIMLALLNDGLYVAGQERHLAIDYTAEDLEEIDALHFNWPRIYEQLEKEGFYSIPIARYEAGEIEFEEMAEGMWETFRNFLNRAHCLFASTTSGSFQ